MELITNTWWIWLCLSLLGWGAVFFIKYRSPVYLMDTESFGENIAVYCSLWLKMFAGLVVALTGTILLIISALNSF